MRACQGNSWVMGAVLVGLIWYVSMAIHSVDIADLILVGGIFVTEFLDIALCPT